MAEGLKLLMRPERAILIVLLMGIVYSFLWPGVTGDVRIYLTWLDAIFERGRIGAFAEPFSDYTPPYLYLLSLFSPLAGLLGGANLIKALSVGATLLLVLAVRHLLKVCGFDRNFEMAIWVALLPTVAVNSAGLGQCDAIWAAACVMAVASAVSRKPVAMLVWFGVGISFKAQAVFLAPFIAQRLLSERTSLVLWPVPGLVYLGAMLPAALVGWPIADLLTVYLQQTEWNPKFISNASNLWAAVQYGAPRAGLAWLWLGLAAAAAASLLFVVAFRRAQDTPVHLIALALLSATLLPFLLPKMHERYFFLADVLAFAYVLLRRDRLGLLVFLLVETASAIAILGLLLQSPLLPIAGSVMTLAAILILGRTLLNGAGAGSDAPHPNRFRSLAST
jgi:Gpi18-like mannosyltransferase